MKMVDASFSAFYLRNLGSLSPTAFTSPVLSPNILLRGSPGQYPSILFRNGATAATQILSATGPGNLYFDAPGSVSFRGVLDNDSYTRMILDSSGRLGIGTTAPAAILSVKGAGTGTGLNLQTANSSNSPLFTVYDNGTVSLGPSAYGSNDVNTLNVLNNQSAAPATSGTAANGLLRLSSADTAVSIDAGVVLSPAYGWIQSRARTTYATNYNLVLNPNGGNVGIGTTSPAAKLEVNGNGILKGLALPVSGTQTSAYNATVNDFLIPCDTSGGNFSVNLPQLSTVPSGFLLSIKKISNDSNTLTIDGFGSETIDGQLTQTTITRYKNFLLCAASGGWHILSTYL